MNQQETEARATELAGEEQECPEAHEGHEGYMDGSGNDKPCHRCKGTGKVFVFDDSVRVPCPCRRYVGIVCAYHNPWEQQCSSCCRCGGRGWTASLDFVTWCRAVADILRNPLSVHVWWPGPVVVTGTLNGSRDIPIKLERLLTALALKEQHGA